VPYSGIAGTVALVTGSAGGIGRAVVAALTAQGATVLGWDCCDLAPPGTERVDVTDPPAVAAAVERAETQVGPVSILVNAAGVMRDGPVLDLSAGDWASVLAVNVTGVFEVSRQVGRRMKQRRAGRIVTVASNASAVPRVGMAAYCASKAASAMLTRCLGLELAGYGIRCNVVSPGSTDTPMLRALWANGGSRDSTLDGAPGQYRLGIPLRRIAEPADVADAVAFLVADESRHITMHELCVDGGATLGC
jgi:2,3-dihydro-2,3-dihydroxybenzoate dehydrogenase